MARNGATIAVSGADLSRGHPRERLGHPSRRDVVLSELLDDLELGTEDLGQVGGRVTGDRQA
jgi:hypothetical protein